jgi:hypothetical protein
MKHVAGSAFVLLGLISSIQALPRSNIKPTPIPLPSNNAISNKFSSWLSAFNTADEATINDFYSTSYNESCSEDVENCKPKFMASPAILAQFANLTGGFELVDLESNPNDTTITVLLRQKTDVSYPRYFRTSMAIDQDKPEQPITSLEILPVTTPLKLIPKDDPNWNDYEKALQPLTPFRRERLIEDIINVLRQQYVYPDQVEEKVAIIINNLKNGEYDSITDNQEFGMRVSKDLGNNTSRVFSGPHIGFHEPSWLLEGSREAEKKQMQKRILERDEHIKEIGYGFGNLTFDTETIPSKTIGTLSITQLFELNLPGVLFASKVNMESIADVDILILDLRNCFGVDDKIVAYILSFLFDEPKDLTKSIDRHGVVHNTTSIIPISGLPRDIKLYGGKKPIYVLTNQYTTWEAESLAYSLQAYQRAVIVGEDASTAGWAHPRKTMVELCEDVFGKGWWRMWIQTLRTVHLAKGSDWENVGVRSDVVVEATGDARLAAIEFENRRIEREEGIERQDELK